MKTISPVPTKALGRAWMAMPGDGVVGSASERIDCRTSVATKWHEMVSFLVPVGYEDEKGFHYGAAPTPRDRTGERQ